MINLRGIIAVGVAAFVSTSCNMKIADDNAENVSARTRSVEKTTGYSDLKMFELMGPVKECITETFYKCEYNGDKIIADTTDIFRRSTQVSFDKAGRYITAKDELVKRDDKGRMTYWRDARPNDASLNPGKLRDTLSYIHLNNNVLESSGMDEYAVTVYDNQGRVVGMYSQNSTATNAHASAFNVYRKEDMRGNWIERLTVWTSRGVNGQPHVTYSLTRRSITYYKN